MTRLLTLLGLLLATGPASAQQAVLGGWALPEGAVVRSETEQVTEAVLRASGQEVPFEAESTDLATTTMVRVVEGRLQQATQRLEQAFGNTWIDGSRLPDAPDPLLGRAVAIERTADGWVRSALGWAPDAAAQAKLGGGGSLDDAEYPLRPVAVGETVAVPDSALRVVYDGATEGPHRLTVRLDSLGTVDGAPVAYLTQEVAVEVGVDGGTMRMDMTARIVRRLDWMLDVETVWEGDVLMAFPGFEIDGAMRSGMTQTVELPDGARLLEE